MKIYYKTTNKIKIYIIIYLANIIPGSCTLDTIFWSQWSDWSLCNGSSDITRTRNCMTNQSISCTESSDEIDLCYSQDILFDVDERKVKANNLITTLPVLEKEYSVYFKIKPWYFGLQCLIHLTNRNDVGYYGERTPGVFLFENGEVHIGSAVNGDYNYGTNTEKLPLYEWSSLQIMQTQTNGTYFYTVYLNGTKIFSIINAMPESFQNVKVYSGDPWYNHGNVSIKDLRIKSGNRSE
nr:uncharacterized protein LOC124806933 [Hydra vulgaris]